MSVRNFFLLFEWSVRHILKIVWLFRIEFRTEEKEKIAEKAADWFVEKDGNLEISVANLEKFLGSLNFAANVTHLGRSKIYFLLKEFLASKDMKDQR